MKIPNANSSLFERIDYGTKKAIEDVILEHKQQGRSIHISKNGKVVEIPPEKIKITPLNEDE